MQVDHDMLQALETISKKLASPEELLFTEKELWVVKKLKQRTDSPSQSVEQILGKNFLPQLQPKQ